MSVVVVAIVLFPLAGALVAVLAGPHRADVSAKVSAGASGASFTLSALLCWPVVADGPVSAAWGEPGVAPVVGLLASRVDVVLLLLITSVSAIVQVYARRYLWGDSRAWWFTASTGLLTGASAALVTSATLIVLALAWTMAGFALCLLLATYPQLESSKLGVRRTVRAFAIGDGALWIAVAVVTIHWGNIDLIRLSSTPFGDSPVVLTLVAVLVVIAALSRSAQLPFQSWLPATLAAPTPVSALLHAGVVNAGGILLVTLSPMVSASGSAMALTFVAGAATTIYGSLLMLGKPDIKGALAHSTMAQMGFMIMTCGLGLYAAAVFHLVAHGMYKATLFLSSGSVMSRLRRHGRAPRASKLSPQHRRSALGFALVIPAATLLAAAGLVAQPPGNHASDQALLIFAWASGAAAMLGWLRRHATARGALTATILCLAASIGYVALVRASIAFLDPAIPIDSTLPAAPVLVALVAITLALVSIVSTGASSRSSGLRNAVYVWALNAGHVDSTPRATTTPIGAPR